MGNVPIPCCRSKSPRLHQSSSTSGRGSNGNFRIGSRDHHSTSNQSDSSNKGSGKFSNSRLRNGEDYDGANSGQPSHILQHISEREPDDSETDPSSNPLNRPIFAERSSNKTNKNYRANSYNDSYSSSNSTATRKQVNTPLMSSQDHGYNSTTSTNLTQFDGQLNDSFDSSIQIQTNQQHAKQLLNNEINLTKDKRLLLFNSSSNSEDVEQSSPSVEKFVIDDHRRKPWIADQPSLSKASSCSTIFTDGSTISQPNLNQTIKCVSLAIYYHIKNRSSDGYTDIFDETIHPLKIPSSVNIGSNNNNISESQDELKIWNDEPEEGKATSNVDAEPDQNIIYSFVKTLFKAAQLTSEYAITTLVYLERLMTYAEMDLTPRTWRRMFLGAILLSSKVWEDQAVWNVDYAQILEEISVEDINELERQFLELIEFNMNVPSSVYAKYYFHLRTLAAKNGLNNKQTLLTVGEAKAFEAMSRVYSNDWQSSPIHRKSSSILKRHTSLEKLRLNGHARAVLM